MKGDFSRNTFDPRKHYSRVLMQQGRVTLDADPNEQTDILLHYLRTLAADLIGPYGGPVAGGGFHLSSDEEGKLVVGSGRYYVDGILVENDADSAYRDQPFYPMPEDDPLLVEMEDPTGKLFWVYLDVWERHVTHIEDEGMREKALGGPDTCSRSQVVWQVKATQVAKPGTPPQPAPSAELERLLKERDSLLEKINATENPEELARLKEQLARIEKLIETLGPVADAPDDPLDCHAPIQDLVRISAAQLAARVDPGEPSEDPCVLAPEAKYRGTENHLYRIEIHESGKAGVATFKWSRDNGSVVAAWLGTQGDALRVSTSRGFTAGCWVELLDDGDDLLGHPGVLVKIAKVEGDLLSVDPSSVPTSDALAWSALRVNPKVRRWDQCQSGDTVLRQGAVPVSERSAASPNWLDIEDGIQIQFEADGEYRAGDYWLIPARVATGDVEWPATDDKPEALPPRGIEHHFAPLGFVTWVDKELQLKPCTCAFPPLADCSAEGKAKDQESLGFRPAPRPLGGVAKPKPEAPAKSRSASRTGGTTKTRKGKAK
jgi:hypothetical protein